MEVEVTCTCPKCGHEFTEYTDVDMSDYAPDHSWRD